MKTIEITLTPELVELVSDIAKKKGLSEESIIRMLQVKGLQNKSDASKL